MENIFKDILYRAIKYSSNAGRLECGCAQQSYKQGAIDQYEKDMKKAYDWFITKGCNYVYEDSYGDKYVDILEFEVDFFKDMKEQV